MSINSNGVFVRINTQLSNSSEKDLAPNPFGMSQMAQVYLMIINNNNVVVSSNLIFEVLHV